jgi:hypothetical protein
MARRELLQTRQMSSAIGLATMEPMPATQTTRVTDELQNLFGRSSSGPRPNELTVLRVVCFCGLHPERTTLRLYFRVRGASDGGELGVVKLCESTSVPAPCPVRALLRLRWAWGSFIHSQSASVLLLSRMFICHAVFSFCIFSAAPRGEAEGGEGEAECGLPPPSLQRGSAGRPATATPCPLTLGGLRNGACMGACYPPSARGPVSSSLHLRLYVQIYLLHLSLCAHLKEQALISSIGALRGLHL